MDPGTGTAFFGGIKSFFSVWQLCIMQVTPFFLAFFLGAYFLTRTGARAGDIFNMAVVALGLALGFSLLFGILGTPSLEPGATLMRNIRTLRFFSGLFILAVGLLMMLFSITIPRSSRVMVFFLLSPPVGAALAIGYSPCIPPVLSDILNFAGRPGNERMGLALLFLYGMGIGVSLVFVGSMLGYILSRRSPYARMRYSRPGMPALIASLIFMAFGFLLVTGLMVRYKAFLVNLI